MNDGKEQNQQQRTMLNTAIRESLLSLGETIMNTILWHMRLKGVILDDSIDTDIDIFFDSLAEIVGNVADVVMKDVYTNLQAQLVSQSAKGQGTLLLSSMGDGPLERANQTFDYDDWEIKEKIRSLLGSFVARDDSERRDASGVIRE